MTGFPNVRTLLRPVALFAVCALVACSSRQASNEQVPSGREHNSTQNFAGHDGKDSSFAVVAVSREAANHAQVGEAAQIPDWVPRYPNSTPANILVTRQGQRREFDFSFVTDDDAQKVIGWYQQKFNAQQFTVVNSSVFESSAQITAQDAAGRSIITIGVVPAGKRNGVS